MNPLSIQEIMRVGPVIPVIVINELAHAVPLAKALVAGGVRVLEVTLRTPAALAAIRAIAGEVPDAIVGVGTLTRPEEFAEARAAGACFGVSPGLTSALIVDETFEQNFVRAVRNIPLIDVLPEGGINVYDILRRDTLVLTKGAIEKLEARLK